MALKDTREGRSIARLFERHEEDLQRLREAMANDRLCSCGAVITLISGRWIEADGTAMHGESGRWAPHRPLGNAQQREG